MKSLKRILIAGCCATAILVSAPSARSEPISAAIVTAIGLTGFAASAATVAIGFAISIGLQFAATALTGSGVSTTSGIELQLQAGGAQPRMIIWGERGVKGHLAYWNTYGKKNRDLQLVYRLADWECEELSGLWVDGELKTLTSVAIPGGNTEDARYEVDGYGDKFIIRWFSGTDGQLADKELIDNAPAGRWTSDHRGRGVCYCSLTLRHDSDLFKNGRPDITFVVKGAKVYDRRFDDTAGGSGTQRWDDTTTWVYSENNGACLETYLRGLYRQGRKIHGWGLPEVAMSTAHIVAVSNLCDESVTEGGSSVNRYVVSAVTHENLELRSGLTQFMEACGGYYFEAGGFLYVIGGGAQAVVGTLSGDDLVTDGSYQYTSKRGRAEKINLITGTFMDPDSGWVANEYPEVTDPAWLTEDKDETLGLTYDLGSVPSPYQAERIARLRAEANRIQGKLSIEVLEKHLKYLPGDWINYSDEKTSGVWVVEGLTENSERGTIRYDLQRIVSAALSGTSTYTRPPLVAPTLDPGVSNVSNFQVQAVTLAGSGAQRLPALKMTWDDPDDETIDEVIFEIRKIGTTDETRTYSSFGFEDVSGGEKIVSEGILAGTNYEVRCTIATTPSRTTVWSSWESVISGGDYVVNAAAVASAAAGALAAQLNEIGGDISDGWLQIANIVDGPLDGWLEQINDNSRITSLQVQTADALGQIINIQEILVGQEGGITAQALQAVNVSGTAGEAGVALRLQAVSAPAGVTARFAVYLKAGVGDVYALAGFSIDVMPDLTRRVVFLADQFVFSDGLVQPFYVSGGQTFLLGATVKDQMTSVDGKLVVDFAASRISVFD